MKRRFAPAGWVTCACVAGLGTAAGWVASAGAQLPPLPPITIPGSTGSPPPPVPPAPTQINGPGSVDRDVDPARDGYFADLDVVPPLVSRWQIRFAAGQALAADGRAYLIGQSAIRAVDLRTGAELWQTAIAAGNNGVAYDAGRLFVPEGDYLVALDAASGRENWRVFLTQVAFADAPVAAAGIVYEQYEQGGGSLLALRESDGSLVWSAHAPDGAAYAALDSGRVYAAGACANATAFDRGTGAVIWRYKTGCSGGGFVTPALHDRQLWIPDGDLEAAGWLDPPILSADTGTVTARYRGGHPVFLDGRAVISTGSTVTALDASTRQQVWQRTLALIDPLAIGHDVFGFVDGHLSALDGETGALLWRSGTLSSPFAGAPFALGAAPETLLVAAGGRVGAFVSALRPPPRGVAIFSRPSFVFVGGHQDIVGAVGHDLRGQHVPIELDGVSFPGHRLHRVASDRTDLDGGFTTRITLFRGGRYRVTADGAASGELLVYAFPEVTLGNPQYAAGGYLRLPIAVRAPRTRLAGLSFVLYLHRFRSRWLGRIAVGRLHSAGSGRTRTSLVFRPLTHVSSRDDLYFCVRGELELGLGYPDALARRCGASRLPYQRLPS